MTAMRLMLLLLTLLLAPGARGFAPASTAALRLRRSSNPDPNLDLCREPSRGAPKMAVELVDAARDTFRETLPLQGILVAIGTRIAISEVRRVVERPVMNKVAGKVKEQFTPAVVTNEAWAKLGLCIVLDLIGDASELLPFLGELTDVAVAPADFFLLKLLFNSNRIAGLGFVEEILPFTDIIPTFTIGWCFNELWPTTPLARALGVGKSEEEIAAALEAQEARNAAKEKEREEKGPDGKALLRELDRRK